MAPRRKKKTKRRGLLVVEIIILIILTVALFAAIWVTQKLSLVNYDTKFDRTQVKTSTEANQSKTPKPSKTDQTTQAEVDTTESSEQQSDDEESGYKVPANLPTSDLKGIDMIALVGLDTRPEGIEDYEYDGENSDTMIICCINHNTKSIKLVSIYRDTYLNVGKDYYGSEDYYAKANEAYNIGGPEQFLTMLNLNLDLDMTEYVTVEFKALATAIEMLGGLDVDLTYQEIVHLNNYNIETAAACDMEYVEIELPPIEEFYGAMTRTYHLNGSQAVSFARIRYTDGFDFRRASRQRLILALLKEKAKNADIVTINSVLNAVLPMVTTNLDSAKILSMAVPVLSYSMTTEDQAGFPFVHLEDEEGKITGSDCVIPVTLEYNVTKLHEMLFPNSSYKPSLLVQEYNEQIVELTGYDDTFIAPASEIPDDAEIPQYADGIPTNTGGGEQASEEATGEEEAYPEDEYYYDEATGEYIHY